MNYMDQKQKQNYQGNTTKVTFARMSLPFNATNCISYLLRVNKTPIKVVFVVERYAVRKAKIRPYAVRRLKIKQYAVYKGQGISP